MTILMNAVIPKASNVALDVSTTACASRACPFCFLLYNRPAETTTRLIIRKCSRALLGGDTTSLSDQVVTYRSVPKYAIASLAACLHLRFHQRTMMYCVVPGCKVLPIQYSLLHYPIAFYTLDSVALYQSLHNMLLCQTMPCDGITHYWCSQEQHGLLT